MRNSTHKLRGLISFALLICMLFTMIGVSEAATAIKLSPLGSPTKKTVNPKSGHEFTVSFSKGINGVTLDTTPPSWISAKKSGSNYIVKVTQANTTSSARVGSVVWKQTVGGQTYRYELKITQDAFHVKDSNGTFVSTVKYKVGGESKTLTANYACSLEGTLPSWLKKSQSGNNYTFKADPNPNGSERSCTLTFTYTISSTLKVSRAVTFKQSANSLINVPGNKTFPNTKNTFDFTVTTGYGTVNASSTNTKWLHVTRKSGNTFTVTVDANTTDWERGANITLKIGDITKQFNVKQKASSKRTAISFSDTAQSLIRDDKWTGRSGHLKTFFEGLSNGAKYSTNPNAASYVIERAKSVTYFSWSPKENATGYREKESDTAKDFYAGQTYYGLPYQQFGAYFYYSSAVDTISNFKKKAEASGFGTLRSGKDGGGTYCYSLGPSCGTDCSGFVSYCIGATEKKSSGAFYTNANSRGAKIDINRANVNALKPGDILWRNGHVVLVVSVIKIDDNVSALAIMESRGRTTASGRNLHVFYDSDYALRMLFGGKTFSECQSMLSNLLYVSTDGENKPKEPLHCGTTDQFISSFSRAFYIIKTSGLSIELDKGANFFK